MLFISGITGHVGGAAARRLLAQGHSLRALVRDPDKAAAWAAQGVELVRGDLTDPTSLAAALRGVDGAFLMMPPIFAPARGFPEAHAIIASFTAALRQVQPRIVLLSSIGSERASGLGNITSTALIERALENIVRAPLAFVRAGSFLENYVPNLQRAAQTGVFDSYLAPTDRGVPMIASEDIGHEVARLLAGDWQGRRVIELGTRRSPDDLARAMAEVLGRPVEARAIPRAQWSASLEAMGLPPGAGWAFEEMEDSFNSGWIDFGVAGTEPVAATLTPAEVFSRATAPRGHRA